MPGCSCCPAIWGLASGRLLRIPGYVSKDLHGRPSPQLHIGYACETPVIALQDRWKAAALLKRDCARAEDRPPLLLRSTDPQMSGSAQPLPIDLCSAAELMPAADSLPSWRGVDWSCHEHERLPRSTCLERAG